MKYWQPKYETMNPEETKRLQLKRLQQSVKLVYDNVPFYRQNFKAAGVTPEDIKTLDQMSENCLLPGKPTFGTTILSGFLLQKKKI